MPVGNKDFSVKVLSEPSRQKFLSEIHQMSDRIALQIRKKGHHKAVEVLGPTVIRSAYEDMTSRMRNKCHWREY